MIDISIESINYVGKNLFTKLTEMVHFLRVDGTYSTDAIKQTLFNDIVKRHTGMNVNLSIPDYGYHVNAHAIRPNLNRNHPFSRGGEFSGISDSDGIRLVEMSKKELRGTVNLSTGIVGGVYSDYPLEIAVYLGMMKNTTFTPGEVASAILHELGHLFTYFQYMHTVAFGGLISSLAAKEIMGARDKGIRVDILQNAERLLGIESTSLTDNIEKVTPENVQIVLFRNYLTAMYSATGTMAYDLRNKEQLADQFATKHGAGRDSVTLSYKMDKMYGDRSTMSQFSFTVLEAGKLILFLAGLGTVIFAPVSIIALLMSQPSGYKIYDDPAARALLTRQQIIQNIKDVKRDGTATEEVLNSMVEDIEVIDTVLKTVKDRRTLAEMFWQSIPGPGTNLRKQEMAAKQLESMLFNDLEYQSTRFELLTK